MTAAKQMTRQWRRKFQTRTMHLCKCYWRIMVFEK